MADLVSFGEATLRLSPPRGERLSTAGRFDAFVGGTESAAAVAAAQLGVDVRWLSRLPDSPLGRRVVRELEGHGVRTDVAWADAETARVATHYRERTGRPRAAGRHERTVGAVSDVDAEALALDAVREATLLATGGVAPALSPAARQATGTLLETAAAADTAVAFDATYRADLWDRATARQTVETLLSLVDILVIDRADAVAVLETSDQRVELAHGLATAHDLRTVVVTRADGGPLALHDGEIHERPSIEAETVDPLGAREAFVGGFLSARLDGEPMPAALDRGAAAAALARSVEGDLLATARSEVASVVERAGD